MLFVVVVVALKKQFLNYKKNLQLTERRHRYLCGGGWTGALFHWQQQKLYRLTFCLYPACFLARAGEQHANMLAAHIPLSHPTFVITKKSKPLFALKCKNQPTPKWQHWRSLLLSSHSPTDCEEHSRERAFPCAWAKHTQETVPSWTSKPATLNRANVFLHSCVCCYMPLSLALAPSSASLPVRAH